MPPESARLCLNCYHAANQPTPNQAQQRHYSSRSFPARFPVLCCAWFVLVVVLPGATYESVGRTFESCRAHHSFNDLRAAPRLGALGMDHQGARHPRTTTQPGQTSLRPNPPHIPVQPIECLLVDLWHSGRVRKVPGVGEHDMALVLLRRAQ
jgi:hypothetical protein